MQTLFPTAPRPAKGRRITALKITLYHRSESRKWQARIHVFGKPVIRISTGTESKHAAFEAAELAYRHFSRTQRS